MKSTLRNICMLLIVTITMASCLNSSNDTETTLYNDAVITSFTLGTLKRTVHTTVTGDSTLTDGTTVTVQRDSTYTQTVTGSNYKFNIDQMAGTIYNTDSLPTGTDVAHVICTVTSLNSGVIVLQDIDSDTLRYYSSTDSIDFTKPRRFVVYSTDGTSWRPYIVSVNAHQEEANGFKWQLTDSSWAPDPSTVVLPDSIRMLIGAATTEQYALSTDSLLMVSYDGGEHWQADLLDDSAELLPTDDIAMVSYPMNLADKTDYVLMAGRREVTINGTKTWQSRVWRKIVDYSSNALAGRWAYMDTADDNPLTLPALEQLQMVKYDDGVLAIGKPYTQIYQSRDNGITWKNNPVYQLPSGFDASATSVKLVVDADNFLWLYCEGTGQVWRGRLNKLGWDQ